MRELSAGQVRDLDPIPFIADEQILIGRKRLDALGEGVNEIFGTSGGGLMSNRVNDAEHVLGAMIDLAHEEVLVLLALFAFGNVLDGAAEAHGPAPRSGTLKISKSVSLHPADLAISPPDPELAWGARRIGGIERRLPIPTKPFRIVSVYPLPEDPDQNLYLWHRQNYVQTLS